MDILLGPLCEQNLDPGSSESAVTAESLRKSLLHVSELRKSKIAKDLKGDPGGPPSPSGTGSTGVPDW